MQTFIKELKIYKNIEDSKEVIRSTKFRQGLNFIVDESRNEKGNNVGKTTALKVIDVCFGAKDKKYIYTSSKTNSIIQSLYDEIEKCNITAELTISTSFPVIEKKDHILTVELKEKGKYFFDNKKYSRAEYLKLLNKNIFKINEKKPTFRQLIPKFVRIGLRDDKDNEFLKFLGSYPSTDDYRLIYNYLFGFFKKNSKIEEISNLTESIKKEEKYLKELQKRNPDISNADQKLTSLKDFLTPKQQRLDALIQGEDFETKTIKINENRAEYTDIEKKIFSFQYEISKIDKNIKLLKETKQTINRDVLNSLYDEIKEFKPLEMDFNDLVLFNEKIENNQNKFQQDKRNIYLKKISDLQERKKLIKQEMDFNLGLVNNIDINEYNTLQKDVDDLNRQIVEITKDKELLTTTLKVINSSKKELTKLEQEQEIGSDELDAKRRYFNDVFMRKSNSICNEGFDIIFPDTGFPLKISPIQQGIGTGRSKALVTAFDLSYIEYAKKYNLSAPYFIIHDVLESIDEFSFKAIKSEIDKMISNDIQVQYIGSILSEKIKDYDFIDKEMIVETVSEEEKYFKIP